MKALVALCLFGVSFCLTIEHSNFTKDDAWKEWKYTYKREYEDLGAEKLRYAIWKDNLERITEFNKNSDSLFLQMNQFGDLTHKEFRFLMNRCWPRNITLSNSVSSPGYFNGIPDTVDWRDKGCVTPVRNQGELGQNWHLLTVESLEGCICQKTGKLVLLSAQNLLDCVKGSIRTVDDGFGYIEANGGIDTEQSYPYEGEQGKCRFKKSGIGAKISSFIDVRNGDEKALKMAVATAGPVAVIIDASHFSFQFYRSGVYDEPKCSSTLLDHDVLVVGYGTYQGKDYWLVKNSWGTSWGMDGYIRMSRNKNNQCGIASSASYPIPIIN